MTEPSKTRASGVLFFHLLVEGVGTPARDAESLPGGGLEVLGEEDYLADVLAVVRELAVDGLDDGVRLAAYGDGAHEVFRLQRSEEHTSELQSRQYIVCRLLLEKKKY